MSQLQASPKLPTSHWFIVFLAGLSLLLWGQDSSAQVHIRLQFDSPQKLRVEYQMPPNCPRLRFEKDGVDGQRIRAPWKSQNACFAIDGDYLLAQNPSCQVASFQVDATSNKVRGYPAAFPMGQALYAHTSNYQVDTNCGELSYEFIGPNVALEGKQYSGRADLKPKADYTFPVLFSPRSLNDDQGVLSYIDPSVSPAYTSRIQEHAVKTIQYLKSEMPKAQFMMPIIAAANIQHPGDLGFDGDAGNVLRLSLFNWPEQLTDEANIGIRNFVTHEFSHRFQKRDEVDVYPISRVIHEGGGEYLRWVTSVAMGLMSQPEAAKDLDDALNRCLLGADNRAWQTLSAQTIAMRQLEYRCGLPAYVYGLAARQNKAAAIQNVAAFYARIQSGERPDFFDAIECGDKLACHPVWLPKLFSGTKSVADTWAAFFDATGLANRVSPNQAQLDLMTKKAFSLLMKDDCGESSVFEASDGLIVDDLKMCKRLKKDMKVIGVEGLPIFGHAKTLSALLAACKHRGVVNLQVAKQADIELPCVSAHETTSTFYAVNIQKLWQRLQ